MTTAVRFFVVVRGTGSQPALLSFVPKMLALTVLLAASSFLPLYAQFFDASEGGGPVTITSPWRFHTGDDQQWASPTYDDSQWPLLRMDKSWNVQGYGGYSGYAWYRIRLQLPESKELLALGLDWVAVAAEVYADGHLIAEMGQMKPEPVWRGRLPRDIVVVPLPPSLYGRTIEFAIRAWQSPQLAPRFGTGSAQLPRLGNAQAIRQLHDLSVDQSFLTFLPDWTVMIVALVIGLISFGLFALRPRATEYAWAGLYLLCETLFRGFNLYRRAHQLPTHESVLVLYSLSGAAMICWFFLVWGFMHARADRLLRIGIFLALCMPLATFLVIRGVAEISTVYILRASIILCIGLLIFARLLREAWRGNRDARVFLVPFLLYTVMDAVLYIRGAFYYAGLSNTNTGLEFYRGPYFVVTWDRVGFLLAHLAIGAVLVRRFARSAEQEQRLATEMESARQVQAQLVPQDFPRLSGFHIEAAYLPAAEVGGDFYQVLEQCDGSVVIVVGDVCGKGLKAAMTGVLAIGAIRALASQGLDPGLLLTRLNREMVGSQNSGFITCICAHVRRDGTITLADAGHPPPYRNGEEIQLESGLPLGITPGVEYAETCVQLAAGDSLTFLSDGVVEARSKADGFFGFDRMREISRQPAQAIARAAQRFGQEDDITVLTVSFMASDLVPA